jgi:hypothetical protein
VWKNWCVELINSAWPLIQTLMWLAIGVLSTELEHCLHAHTDTQNRKPTSETTFNNLISANFANALNTCGKGTYARNHKSIGCHCGIKVNTYLNCGASCFQCTLRGAHIS